MLTNDTKYNEKYEELYKQLRVKLINNNIYLYVNKNIIFDNSVIKIKPKASLIRSGVKLSQKSDYYTFIIIYKDLIDNESTEDEDFGLIEISLFELADKLIKDEIQAMYVLKQSNDLEVSSIVQKLKAVD